jgi:hypothetical protein
VCRVGPKRKTLGSGLNAGNIGAEIDVMFITRALERGIDVKVLAQWQGHMDGGKLILDTYSHVRPLHSQRMAQLMTTEEPANVIAMRSAS